ncbi:hypothetical protein CDD83_8314 [Cordyceps sp. RAO-2017]|nr:hypothetical protein CDD83_8314 [Cordyceps sp. RAO-2017]
MDACPPVPATRRSGEREKKICTAQGPRGAQADSAAGNGWLPCSARRRSVLGGARICGGAGNWDETKCFLRVSAVLGRVLPLPVGYFAAGRRHRASIRRPVPWNASVNLSYPPTCCCACRKQGSWALIESSPHADERHVVVVVVVVVVVFVATLGAPTPAPTVPERDEANGGDGREASQSSQQQTHRG